MPASKQEYNHPCDQAPYRTDITRTINRYDDLAKQLVITYKTYAEIESNVAPFVARNADNSMFVLTKEWIHEKVKNNHGMNSFMYNRLLNSVEEFFTQYRTSRRLPSPHIISHRSIHLCEGLFDVKQVDTETYLKESPDRNRGFKVNTVHAIEIGGCRPFYIENMRKGNYKYMILRPKLGKSGAPTIDRWEILLYHVNFGYYVQHIDTDKNPRYNGMI
jgi:hypothetical protein